MHESPSSHSECWVAGSIEQKFSAISFIFTKKKYSSTGIGASSDFDPPVAFSHRFRLDLGDSHAHHGGPLEVDLLGRGAELLAAVGYNCLHDNSRLLRWPDECGRFERKFMHRRVIFR